MIDHVSANVDDLESAKTFYVEALAPLGYSLQMDFPGSAAGFGTGKGIPAFWISTVEQEMAAAVRLIELEQENLQLRRQLSAAGTTVVASTAAGGGGGGAGRGGVAITTGSNGRPTLRAGGGGGASASTGQRPGGGGAVPVTFKPPARPQHPEGLPF